MGINRSEISRLAVSAERYCSSLLDLLYEQYKTSWNVAGSPLLTGREGENMRAYLTDVSLRFLNSLMSAAADVGRTAAKIREMALLPDADVKEADRQIRTMSQELLDRIGKLSAGVGLMRDAGFTAGGVLDSAAVEKLKKEITTEADFSTLLDQWSQDPYFRARYPLQRREEPWRDAWQPDLFSPFGGSLLTGRYLEQCSKDGVITLTERVKEKSKPSGKAPEIRVEGVADTARGSGSVQGGTDDMLGYISAADGVLSAIGYYRTAYADSPDYEQQMSFTSLWDNRAPVRGRYLYDNLCVSVQGDPTQGVNAIVDGEVTEMPSARMRLDLGETEGSGPDRQDRG